MTLIAPRAPLPQPTLPEVAGHGGINLDDVTRAKNILLQVGPYNNFLAGDHFDVLWGDGETLVGSATVREASTLYAFVDLSSAQISNVGSGTHPFFYRFTSSFGGDPVDSPLPYPTVRVKLDVPGNPDPGPDPINTKLIAPAVEPMVIDSAAAERGATVTVQPWENMDADDVLTLLWGSESLIADKLTVGQPVVIPVTEDTILAAMDNPALPVRFRVIDAVGNASKLSPSTEVNVQATVTFFDRPKVKEATSDTLDLDELGQDDVNVLVDTEQDGINIGDDVVLIWAATTGNGTPLPEETFTLTVTGASLLNFIVPNASVVPLAKGFFRVSYVVNDRQSQARNIDVIGEIQTLGAPTVQEARDGMLDPANVIDFAHIQVDPYVGMGIGDNVTYFWKGVRDGVPVSFLSDSIKVKEEDVTPEKKPLIFDVLKSEVELLTGAMLEVYYIVKHVGQDPLPPSSILKLDIVESGESDAEGFDSAPIKEYRYNDTLVLPSLTIQNAQQESGEFSFFITDEPADGMSGNYLLAGGFSDYSQQHQYFNMLIVPQFNPKSIKFNFSHNSASGMDKLPIEILYSDGVLERRIIIPGMITVGIVGERTIDHILLKNQTPSYSARFDSFRFFD